MGETQHKFVGTEFLEGLSRTYSRSGLQVKTRCTIIRSGKEERFEIVLEANGERSIVDVPGCDERMFVQYVEDAVIGFVESIKFRTEDFSLPLQAKKMLPS